MKKLNALVHHIEEIKSVEPYEVDWTKKIDKKFLKIKVITNCYDLIEERETVEKWEKLKNVVILCGRKE